MRSGADLGAEGEAPWLEDAGGDREGERVGAHEDDVGGLDGDVGAGADRDADVGAGEGGIPGRDRSSPDGADRALAGDRLERVRVRRFDSACGCRGDDCICDRVLALALDRGDEPQQVVFVDAVRGGDRDDLGLAAGEGAGRRR